MYIPKQLEMHKNDYCTRQIIQIYHKALIGGLQHAQDNVTSCLVGSQCS